MRSIKQRVKRNLRKSKLWWSYSKLKVFETCKEKFYRQYIRREKVDENQRKFLTGSIVHLLVEDMISKGQHRGPSPLAWLLDHIEPYYEDFLENRLVRFYKGDTKEKFIKSITKSIINVDKYLEYRGIYSKDIEVVSELHVKEDVNHNVLLNGKIDLLLKDGDFWTIIDLKDSSLKRKSGVDVADKTQMIFYNLLLYVKYGRIANRSEFFMCKDYAIVPAEIVSKEISVLAERIKKATMEVRKASLRIMTTNVSDCWRCKYREPCWSEGEDDVKPGLLKW